MVPLPAATLNSKGEVTTGRGDGRVTSIPLHQVGHPHVGPPTPGLIIETKGDAVPIAHCANSIARLQRRGVRRCDSIDRSGRGGGEVGGSEVGGSSEVGCDTHAYLLTLCNTIYFAFTSHLFLYIQHAPDPSLTALLSVCDSPRSASMGLATIPTTHRGSSSRRRDPQQSARCEEVSTSPVEDNGSMDEQ